MSESVDDFITIHNVIISIIVNIDRVANEVFYFNNIQMLIKFSKNSKKILTIKNNEYNINNEFNINEIERSYKMKFLKMVILLVFMLQLSIITITPSEHHLADPSWTQSYGLALDSDGLSSDPIWPY